VIEAVSPDILCLQETKVADDLFPYDFFKSHGYIYNTVRGQPSYNGVAILSKIPFELQEYIPFKQETRHLSIIIKNLELHNFYVPSGGDIPDPNINQKFASKLEFLDIVVEWFKNKKMATDKIILLGDLNIAPLENDVWSHKQMLKEVSHSPIEVEKYNKLRSSIEFFDAHRHFIPEEEKVYSWWSYRSRDWQQSNKGLRVDHILLTEPLKQHLRTSTVFKTARSHPKPSDHVPVAIELAL
jgi:exodeoxyribonuclease-3